MSVLIVSEFPERIYMYVCTLLYSVSVFWGITFKILYVLLKRIFCVLCCCCCIIITMHLVLTYGIVKFKWKSHFSCTIIHGFLLQSYFSTEAAILFLSFLMSYSLTFIKPLWPFPMHFFDEVGCQFHSMLRFFFVENTYSKYLKCFGVQF